MARRRCVWWSFVTPLLTVVFAFSLVAPALTVARQSDAAAVHGINPADMDVSVDPAEDFYRFANGGWLDRTEIPEDKGAYGVFDELIDRTRERLLDLLSAVASSGDLQAGSDEWTAAEIYRQGTDIESRNAQGIEPIQPILARVDAIQDLDDFHEFQRTAAFSWLTGLFWIYAYPDLADSTVNAVYISGSFVGLPNQDYYLEGDEDIAEVRAAYLEVCAELLGYIGYDDAGAEAAALAVFGLEQALAEPILTRAERQDASISYNPTSVADLAKMYPLMDWDAYLAELGLTGIDTINVDEPRYLRALAGIVSVTPIETLKDFVKLEVLWSFAGLLGEDIGETAFSFRGGVLSGVDQQAPLEERVLDETSSMLGEAIGRLYVEEYFPPEAKGQVTEMVEALIVAFRARLDANTWMSDETKAEALAKLDGLGMKIGYPDRWRSYEAVEIADSYVGSFLSAVNADTRYNLDKAGKPVDTGEWFIPPQTVNAYYHPPANEIVFPAAFLQAPFFDYQADPASNFGGLGFVIGHEITHGFDLQGSQFDADGNLRNWWTEADRAAFDELNQRAADQYSAIEVLPGISIDGRYTVTENVADLGGVQVAYDALLVYLDAHGDILAAPLGGLVATPGEGEVALTQQQRFFVAAATVWRQKIRDESLETYVRTNVHAPSEQRATVPSQNMDEFYEAFGIEPGDAMYLPPEERITIW